MKLRLDFVTNSSSTSYVCDICGSNKIIYSDEYELEYVSCKNGHEMCIGHVPRNVLIKFFNRIIDKNIMSYNNLLDDYDDPRDKKKIEDDIYELKILKKHIGNKENSLQKICSLIENIMNQYIIEEIPNIDEDLCPMCSLDLITYADMFKYLCKISSKDKTEIIKEIKTKFKTYTELQKYLKAGNDNKKNEH